MQKSHFLKFPESTKKFCLSRSSSSCLSESTGLICTHQAPNRYISFGEEESDSSKNLVRPFVETSFTLKNPKSANLIEYFTASNSFPPKLHT